MPFVIDNQQQRMADVLNTLLSEHAGWLARRGDRLLQRGWLGTALEGLRRLGTFRLLLGDEPETGADLGLREARARTVARLLTELAGEQFNERNLRLVEDLIAYCGARTYRCGSMARAFYMPSAICSTAAAA